MGLLVVGIGPSPDYITALGLAVAVSPSHPKLGKMASSLELIRYQPVLRDRQNNSGTDETDAIDPTVEELRMSPLVWWNSNEHIEPQQRIQRGYAVLGHIPEAESSMRLFC
jgi:hypothetical protein